MSTVKNFITNFQAQKIQNSKMNPNAVSEYLKKNLEIKTYVPFVEKRELCKEVIEASCSTKNGIVTVDSVSRYILFTIAILAKYTNLEFNSDEKYDSLDEYDELCESGLLDAILDVIGDEYVKCNNLLNMMIKDVIDNNNTIEAVLTSFSNGVLTKVNDIADVVLEKIETMDLDLSQIDIDKFESLLGKLGGLEK